MAAVRRLLAFSAVAVLVAAVALPALATDAPADEGGPQEPATDTETAPAPPQPAGARPAMTMPPPPPPAGPDDWTYRYLIPTLLALAVIVVVFTTVQYFTQVVRKRYKVVE